MAVFDGELSLFSSYAIAEKTIFHSYGHQLHSVPACPCFDHIPSSSRRYRSKNVFYGKGYVLAVSSIIVPMRPPGT